MHEDTEHTPLLRRLWGLSERSRLGRPAVLDVEQVVRAAIERADRNGLADVTLPKVAKTLDVTSMSLYRYIGSKDELLVLMVDRALGPPPALDGSTWRVGLRHWAVALHALYLRRPWIVRVPTAGPPSGPNQIAWMDAALRALRGTSLDWAQKIGALMLVSGHVRHSVTLSQDLAAGRPDGSGQAETEREYGRHLAALVDPDDFPEAAKVFGSSLWQGEPPDDPAADFMFGLDLILDGIHARTSAQPP